MSAARRFATAASLSYRGLFTWLNPWGYVSTRIGAPVALTLLFGALGRYSGEGAARPVIGGALLTASVAALYGLTMAVANERDFGTLELTILAPSGLLSGLASKAVPHIVDGLLGAAVTISVGGLVFAVGVPVDVVLPLALAALAAVTASSGVAVFSAAVALRTRDTFTPPGIFQLAVTLVSGVFVAVDRLPVGVGPLPSVLPVSHALRAALESFHGAGLAWRLLLEELVVGATWGLLGCLLLYAMVASARRRGSLTLL